FAFLARRHCRGCSCVRRSRHDDRSEYGYKSRSACLPAAFGSSIGRTTNDQVSFASGGDWPAPDGGAHWGSDHCDAGKAILMNIQDPTSNIQRSSKIQIPRTFSRFFIEGWLLDLLWILDL